MFTQMAAVALIDNSILDMVPLNDTAKEFAELTGEENVFDLYCGIGTIGIFVADKAKKHEKITVMEE